MVPLLTVVRLDIGLTRRVQMPKYLVSVYSTTTDDRRPSIGGHLGKKSISPRSHELSPLCARSAQ